MTIHAGYIREYMTCMFISIWQIAMAFRAAEAARRVVDVALSAGNARYSVCIVRPVTFGTRGNIAQRRNFVACWIPVAHVLPGLRIEIRHRIRAAARSDEEEECRQCNIRQSYGKFLRHVHVFSIIRLSSRSSSTSGNSAGPYYRQFLVSG